MPELGEQMYCSEQICIPPAFPYLLRQFAKAAIRTQPTDLLKWSTAYFRCLSLNIPPPVKPRLEYPIPKDYCGVTPGWLKALMYQLQNNITVPFKILWDRWTGACLRHEILIQILCLGGFSDPNEIPWLRFVGLCASFLSENLTHTMILVCEIMTEEPEGGSASITVETFIDVYKFLAVIDASQPQILKNIYFTDSLLSLYRPGGEKEEQPEVKEETVSEVESSRSQVSEKVEEEEVKRVDSKEVISCPSIEGDDNYSMEYYIEQAAEEGDGDLEVLSLKGTVGMNLVGPEASDGILAAGDLEAEEEKIDEDDGEKRDDAEGEEGEKEGDEGGQEGEDDERLSRKGSGEEETASRRGDDEETSPDAKDRAYAEETEITATGEELTIEPATYESVDTIQEEPRKIEPDYFEDEKTLQEDLERLKALQQELPGETDDELEKFKCRLMAEMPLTKSQQLAIGQYVDAEKPLDDKGGEEEEAEGEEVPEPAYEEFYCGAVPGIGPIVPEALVTAVCDYMLSVAPIQHGMVMPRNIRHYNCPPLEVLQY